MTTKFPLRCCLASGYAGDNECLIWGTFARRGLGINAKQRDFENKADGSNGFKVPDHCPPVKVPKKIRRASP